jgi:hypothetical protein
MMAAALDIQISWLSEFAAPISFQAAPNLYVFLLRYIFISFVDTEEMLKKFYVISVKYFIRERSVAQKNVFTFYLFSSFVNNELESKCFY